MGESTDLCLSPIAGQSKGHLGAFALVCDDHQRSFVAFNTQGFDHPTVEQLNVSGMSLAVCTEVELFFFYSRYNAPGHISGSQSDN